MDLTAADAPTRVPLQVRVVTDGRAGIEAQALGLAEALGRLTAVEIEVRRVRWRPWLRRLPTRLAAPALVRDPASDDPLAGPPPDIWIGNGRAAAPFSIAMRRRSAATGGRRPFVVQLQDPLRDPALFDLVIAPRHDRLRGANVLETTGAPHRVSPERLATEAARFPHLARLPHPRVGLLVGGRSRAFDLPPARAAALARKAAEAAAGAGGSLMATFSRRTPPAAQAAMRPILEAVPGFVWDGEGANPYFAILGLADHLVVTEDSINMVAEAAATGRPVHIAKLEGRQARKDRFYAELAALGVARPFAGALDVWTYPPLRETDRAAEAVLQRLAARAIDPPTPDSAKLQA